MVMLPVHTRKIAAFHYDPLGSRLVVAFRNGQLHELTDMGVVAVLRLISKLPVETSEHLERSG
jgi:hypothetical protein